MSSAWEKTAMENNFLNSNKRYIEEVVEYSETILDIHNDIMDNKQIEDDNHRYAMEHITDECNTLRAYVETDIESLRNDIDDLKQMIEELQK